MYKMAKWVLIIVGVIVTGVFIAFFIGKMHESENADALQKTLQQSAYQPVVGRVDFQSLSELPPPVARYFRHVLTDGQAFIRTARMQQSGELRSSTSQEKWSSFTAQQLIVPAATGFVWNAKVRMPFATHVRVVDSYIDGTGSGRVSLLSAFAIAADAANLQLNSGALHRYLAEAVWYPSALLPQSGIVWTALDDQSALATLSDSGTTVSLEFRFNKIGEVTGIYSPGRYGRFDGEYRQVPWEGHFSDYQQQAGMRIPHNGEVGWYIDGALQLVWKGELSDIVYEFE